MLFPSETGQDLAGPAPVRSGWSRDVYGLLTAAVVANLADLVTFLRVNPSLIATDETSPLPHLFGQMAGGLAAKLVMAVVVLVTVAVFRHRHRTAAALLAIYTFLAIIGAASNTLIG